MIDKALLTGAFEKMGPDAVQRGLLGHHFNEERPFERCFLAMAFGAPGELATIVESCKIGAPWVMGLTPTEFSNVWRAVDMNHDAFWALANEWLENRPASMRPAHAEMSR